MKDNSFKIVRGVGLSLYAISILFIVITFSFSIKLDLHHQFSTELIIYVLISEMLFCVSRYFCFLLDLEEKAPIKIASLFQLSLGLFCETWTLVSMLFHVIKIYDAIIRESQWLTHFKMRLLTRLVIFSFPLVKTLILIILQHYYYNQATLSCNPIFCQLEVNLFYYSLALDCTILITMFCFTVYTLCFFTKSIRGTQADSKACKIMSGSRKVWLYPLVTFIYWLMRSIGQVIPRQNDLALGLATIIISSIRGIIYSSFFLDTQENLKCEVMEFLFCCCARKRIPNDCSIDSIDEIAMVNHSIDDC